MMYLDYFSTRYPAWYTCMALLFLFWSLPGMAADDDYLQSLEAEAGKIEGSATPKAQSSTQQVIDAQREEFEIYLEQNQKGTYAFYKKLPAQSREEVFKAFVDGASMRDIRKMVIDRKLNR